LSNLNDRDTPSLNRLSIAALGVVFGDIGTSPLYALRACFSDVAGVAIDIPSVLGVLSLIFWALVLVVSVKYVSIVLRTDNRGEGGVLALTTLVLSKVSLRKPTIVAAVGLAGCALFFGDGVITPAVTVLSAIEGINVATPAFQDSVIPLAIMALLVLFALQRHGTGAIGGLFGPIMLLWFASLAVLGGIAIASRPLVLQAVNPYYAVAFVAEHSAVALAVFAAVFLAVTGGEALYADLGHFGRKPIVRAWFFIAWPSVVLNYFGQGALLLSQPQALHNPFFSLAPAQLLVPLVVLATAASIIASQAVISGVFSVAYQCQQLGFLPRLKTQHSSAEAMGQVYVPALNGLLCIVTVGLVLAFRTSNALAHAYGIAVAGTMIIETSLAIILYRQRQDTVGRFVFGLLVILGTVDAIFFVANLVKIPDGGWFPLLYGLGVFTVMRTWQRGRVIVSEQMARHERSLQSFLTEIERNPPTRAAKTAVFLSSNISAIPRTLVRNLRNNGVLHERTILLNITTERVPRTLRGGRLQVSTLAPGLFRVHAHIGFMEIPDVPKLLRDSEKLGLGFRTDDATFFLGRDDIVIGNPRGMSPWRKRLFLFLTHNSQFAGAHFGIPPERIMEIGGQVQI
jgi:KUP system potassium uptake protein